MCVHVISPSVLRRVWGNRRVRARSSRAFLARRRLLLSLREDKALAFLVLANIRWYADGEAAATVRVETGVAALTVRVLAALRRVTGLILEAELSASSVGATIAVTLVAVGTVLVCTAPTGIGAAERVLCASVAVAADRVTVGVGCLICGTVVNHLVAGCVGIVPLLSIHGAVLSLSLVVLVNDVGVEKAAG
jgi:hypothetical protein